MRRFHGQRAERSGGGRVVGGGIAGVQAALDLADSGIRVYLLERSPAIGGKMAQLDKTFPTNDCAMCIVSPKLVEAGRHINIDIIPSTELISLEGFLCQGAGRGEAIARWELETLLPGKEDRPAPGNPTPRTHKGAEKIKNKGKGCRLQAPIVGSMQPRLRHIHPNPRGHFRVALKGTI
jgi:hypothetical protein